MNKKFIVFVSITVLLFGFSVLVAAQKSPNSAYKVAKAGVGFDGLRIGKSTRSDVIRKYGRNFRTNRHGRYSVQMIYPGGMSFYYCRKDRQQEVFDIELRAPARVKTANGIVLSKSTIAEVKKIYGKAKQGLRFRGIEFYYATYKGKKVVTVIDIVENRGMRQCK